MAFCLIEFNVPAAEDSEAKSEDSTSVGIVPKSWIESTLESNTGEQSVEVAYPPKSSNVRALMKKRSPPQTTWETFSGKILLYDDDLSKLQRKSDHFVKYGDLDSTDVEASQRRRSPDRFMDEYEQTNKPARRKTTKKFPSIPQPSSLVSKDDVTHSSTPKKSHYLTPLREATSPEIEETTQHDLSSGTAGILLDRSNASYASTGIDASCHCTHVQKWFKEVFIILSRIKGRQTEKSSGAVDNYERIDKPDTND